MVPSLRCSPYATNSLIRFGQLERCRVRCRALACTRRRCQSSKSDLPAPPMHHANPHEVHKFTALSDTWWDPTRNPLLAMNVARVQFIRHAVQRNQERHGLHPVGSPATEPPLLGITALDIGCGGGVLSESLARLGADTTGIDPSHALVAVAEQHAHRHTDADTRHRLRYCAGQTVQEFAKDLTLSSPNQLYDIVCCLEVIEHVPDPASLLETACQLLQPDTGLLFVSTINRTNQSYWSTIIGAEYLLGLLPVGTHDWSSYRSPAEVAHMVQPYQMETVETAGMVLPVSLSLPFSMIPAVLQLQSAGSVAANWKWQLDPHDTNVNWIACYRKRA